MRQINNITLITLFSIFILNTFKMNDEIVIVKSANDDKLAQILLKNSKNQTSDFYFENGLFFITEEEKQKARNKKAVSSFLITLSGSESGGVYNVANKYRFVGKYQFGKSALKSIGYSNYQINKIRKSVYLIKYGRYRFDTTYFTPKQQEIAIQKYMYIYESKTLKGILKKYVGTTFNGIYITKAGIYAAAHLGGAGSVKKYFKSGGRINRTDANGTSLKNYMKMFEMFQYDEDLTFVV